MILTEKWAHAIFLLNCSRMIFISSSGKHFIYQNHTKTQYFIPHPVLMIQLLLHSNSHNFRDVLCYRRLTRCMKSI